MSAVHVCTIKGIPVGVDWTFLILIVILSMGINPVSNAIIFGVIATLSLLIHEMGHACMAAHYRLDPQVILGGFGGITVHKSANARQSFKITMMGPLAGLIAAAAFFGINWAFMWFGGDFLDTHIYLKSFLSYGFLINLFWSIFNLVPINPLDGGKLLSALLAKYMKPTNAIRTSVIISLVCCVGVLAWAAMSGSSFNTFIAIYLLIINVFAAKHAFSSRESIKQDEANLRADTISELAVEAARDHQWQRLEMFAYQLKETSTTPKQLERAYEFLTIACTNMGKYEEALKHSERAAKSTAVKRAVDRCNQEIQKKLQA